MLINSETWLHFKNFASYAIVGVLNNLLGYLIYLFLTWFWLEPKFAVTLMYPVGALSGYFAVARYSFNHSRIISSSIYRYVIAHLIGYGVNIIVLYVFSDYLGYPHQLCQAFAIVVVACALYPLLRYFVFPYNSKLS